MWKAGNVINRIGTNPPAVLIWDDESGADVGEARTIEAARMMAAAPAMLAALQAACDQMEQCESMFRDDAEFIAALDETRAAIAAATGAPTDAEEDETACASCGAPEGESHGARCEARGFAMGVAAATRER